MPLVERLVIDCSDSPSMTRQDFKEECDINSILRKFKRTGILSHVNRYQGQYGDFTTPPDYHDAMNKVALAQEMFMTLPALLRKRFDNDPGKFIAFVDDPTNVEEMVKLGIATKRPAPQAQVLDPVSEGKSGDAQKT